MTTMLNIEKKICLQSEYFDKNIKNHIFNKVKQDLENTCSKEYGYILEVNKIIKIKDNYISSNCENIFIVDLEMTTLKPEIDKVFEGLICMIFSGGVFINVKNKLKVLVPISYLSDYNFCQDKSMFINNNNQNLTIKHEDRVNVIISGIKYSKQNFSCFGKLKF